MYSKCEKPIITCSIFYYDVDYKKSTGQQVLNILAKHNMFPPEKFYAGKLTKNRFVYASESTLEVMAQAYSEKDVLALDMGSGDSREVDDYWRVQWNLTFYKSSKIVTNPVFMPWNVLSIYSTHKRMNDPAVYSSFFSCMRELIEFLCPFYAVVDDVSNKVKLMNRAHETHFVPERIQEIYWGNYFGEFHCKHYGTKKIKEIPINNVNRIGNGIFFTLTDHVLDYESRECKQARSAVKKHLGDIGKTGVGLREP